MVIVPHVIATEENNIQCIHPSLFLTKFNTSEKHNTNKLLQKPGVQIDKALTMECTIMI